MAWAHHCPLDGSSKMMSDPVCKQCGGTGLYFPGIYGMMSRYRSLHGVPPIGPHRRLADQLFAGATGVCPTCHGTYQTTAGECSACVMGEVVLKSPTEMEAIRDQIRAQFPEVFAVPEPDASAEPVLGAVSDLDDQALIDVLVFEAWRTGDQARSQTAGEELTSRWVGAQGDGEAPETFLPFKEAILDSQFSPGDYLCEWERALSPSRLEALEAGATLTPEEVEHCRDIAVGQYYEGGDGAYCSWQIVPLRSRTGQVAYLAHIINGDYPCDCDFVGVYRSAAEARDSLKQRGYLSLEQFRIQRGRIPHHDPDGPRKR